MVNVDVERLKVARSTRNLLAASTSFIISSLGVALATAGQSPRRSFLLYAIATTKLHVCTFRNALCIGNIQQSQPRIVHLLPTPFHTLLLQYPSPNSPYHYFLFFCAQTQLMLAIGLYVGHIIPKQETYGVLRTRH